MVSSRQEVSDSDDDDNGLSPLSSPLASPSLSYLEERSQLELPLLAPPPLSTNPADASTSTDPSFFRDVYEEQQMMLGSQLHATVDDFSQHVAPLNVSTERDLWDVPSSPTEVVGQQRESYLKRKREEKLPQVNASIVVQLDHVSSGNEPTRKRLRTATSSEDQPGQQDTGTGSGTGMRISIPLEPLTPAYMHAYPQMLSSSMDDLATSLPRLKRTVSDAQTVMTTTRETLYEGPLINNNVTQSTIAFTTPSLYASSGRRVLVSSNNNSKQSKSSHDVDVIQEKDAIAISSATPQRGGCKAADFVQVESALIHGRLSGIITHVFSFR